MSTQEFRWEATAKLGHFLPHRDGSAWVIAGACREFHTDTIGFGFMRAAMRQTDAELVQLTPRINHTLACAGQRCAQQSQLRQRLLGSLLARMLAQRVSDFMSHHRSDLIIAQFQFVEYAGVDGDLSPGHTPRIDIRRADDVDLPVPFQCIWSEHCGLRDQAVNNAPYARSLCWIRIQVTLFGFLAYQVGISQRCLLFELLAGDQG